MNDQPVIDAYHHEDLPPHALGFPVGDSGVYRPGSGYRAAVTGVDRAHPGQGHPRADGECLMPRHYPARWRATPRLPRSTSCSALRPKAARSRACWRIPNCPTPVVDFNHDPHSAIVDGSQTRVSGPRLVNLLAWFDNEWGFANRMLDVAQHWLDVAAVSTTHQPRQD